MPAKKSPKKDPIETQIEKLAIMVQHGFSEQKAELNEFRKEANERFDDIEVRLDRIENIDLRRHENRIEHLEVKVLKIESSLAHKKR